LSDNEEQSGPQPTYPQPATGGPSVEGEGPYHWVTPEGKIHIIPHWLGRRLHIPEDVRLVDLRFTRFYRNYLVQSGLAVVTMLLVLVFVDSLADAALAAGLGSSVVILFVHPSSPSAKLRSVVGGHSLALLVGACALLVFSSPLGVVLEQLRFLFDLTLALALGALILIMAITDTEHPPAAGTLMGVALQPWDPARIGVIIGAVLMLAFIKWALSHYLRDLI